MLRGPSRQLLVAIVLAMSCAANSSAESYSVASLDDALKIGRARSLVLQEAGKQVEVAKASVKQFTAQWYPTASLSFGGLRQDAVFAMPENYPLSGGKDPGFWFGYEGQYMMRVQVDQAVYTGGRNKSSITAARRQLDVATERERLAQASLTVEVTRSYYAVLLAQQVLKIKQELIAQSERHRNDVDKRLQSGDASRFDLLRAEVQLKNLVPEEIRARNEVDVAMAQLKNTLGLTQNDVVTISGTIECTPEKPDMPSGLSAAVLRRPEVRIATLNSQIDKANKGLATSRLLPYVNAYFSEDLRADTLDNLFNDEHSNWTFGINLTFSFLNFPALYQSRAMQRKVEESQLLEEQVKRDVQVEVIQTGSELQRAMDVIESQKQNVAQAEEAMNIANISYSSGVITNLELMDTQLALDQARTNYVTAVYDYLVGQAKYRKAIGALP